MTRQGPVRRMGGGARSQLPTVITDDRWYYKGQTIEQALDILKHPVSTPDAAGPAAGSAGGGPKGAKAAGHEGLLA